uniref:Uncharacterized protein n=1 Tax=Lepeophtheirus salmonis TaxID=72036 RepID=A0A0K2UTB7_LEPSM
MLYYIVQLSISYIPLFIPQIRTCKRNSFPFFYPCLSCKKYLE